MIYWGILIEFDLQIQIRVLESFLYYVSVYSTFVQDAHLMFVVDSFAKQKYRADNNVCCSVISVRLMLWHPRLSDGLTGFKVTYSWTDYNEEVRNFVFVGNNGCHVVWMHVNSNVSRWIHFPWKLANCERTFNQLIKSYLPSSLIDSYLRLHSLLFFKQRNEETFKLSSNLHSTQHSATHPSTEQPRYKWVCKQWSKI